MQTRRDQLQAYRFQNRRALAALVTGQPNVLEPPMRRLTVTTISGIMIAILIAIVFGVLALIRPSAGDSWKTSGKVIVDQDNNSIYVYSKGTLHPALNYTSAVLAVSGTNSVSRVTVSSSDIAGARYGYEIGSPDFPNSLPGSGSLVSYPMSTCSVLHPRETTGANVRVTLHIGSKGGSKAVPSAHAVVVTVAGGDRTDWLLLGGQRLHIGSPAVASSLGVNPTAALSVGTAFLNSIPQGPALTPPTVAGQGKPADFTLGSHTPTVGSLVATRDPKRTYLVTQNNLVSLSPFELALYPGVHPTSASQTEVSHHVLLSSGTAGQDPLAGFTRLPPTVPTIDADTFTRGGVCAVFDREDGAPHLVIPRGSLSKNYETGPNNQSDTSSSGQADAVDVPATKALLAVSSAAPGTVLVVSEQGVRYAFANAGLISAFGYQASDEVHVPAQLVTLIPSGGTGLSQSAALQRAPR